MKYLLRLIPLFMLFLILSGCGQFNPYKELGVKDDDVPQYEVTGEISNTQKVDEQEIDQKFVNINAEGKTEEEVKKIAADFVQKNTETELIMMNIFTDRKKAYTVDYYANKEASEIAETKEKIDRYPAILFRGEES